MAATHPATALTRRPQLLTDFLNANSSDPATRAMVATTLVLTLWQMGGRAVTPRLPSLLLVHAGGTETDPLDAFIGQYGLGFGHKELPKTGSGLYVGGTPANAPVTMFNCLLERDKLGGATPNNQSHIESLEQRFRDAQATGFGSDGSGTYTRMWNDDMPTWSRQADQEQKNKPGGFSNMAPEQDHPADISALITPDSPLYVHPG